MEFIKFRAHASMCASVESNKIDGAPSSPQQTTQVKKIESNVDLAFDYQNSGQQSGGLVFSIIKRFIAYLGKAILGELLHYLVH